MTETQTPHEDTLGFEDNKAIQDGVTANQLPFDFVKEAAKRAETSQFVDLPDDKEPLTGKQIAGRAIATVAAAGAVVGAVHVVGAGIDKFLDDKDQANDSHGATIEKSEATQHQGVIGDTPAETTLHLEEQTPATSPTNIPTPNTH